MKDLEKDKTYYLGDLNEAECNELLQWLNKNDRDWESMRIVQFLGRKWSLRYLGGDWDFCTRIYDEVNAKELFEDSAQEVKKCLKGFIKVNADKRGYINIRTKHISLFNDGYIQLLNGEQIWTDLKDIEIEKLIIEAGEKLV